VSYSGPDVLLEHGCGGTGELRGVSWRYPEHTFCHQIGENLHCLLTNILPDGVNGQRWRSWREVLSGYWSGVDFDPILWLHKVLEW